MMMMMMMIVFIIIIIIIIQRTRRQTASPLPLATYFEGAEVGRVARGPTRLARAGYHPRAIEALAEHSAAAAALLVEHLPEDRMIIFLWILLLLSACCCCIPLRYLLSNEWPRLRQMLYFPLSGQMRWEHRTQRTRLLRRLNGVEVTLTTADDRVVHAVWVPAPARAPAGACRMPSAMPSAIPPAPCVPPRPLTRAPDCPRRRSLWARERSR